ncbi:MAG: hypothetical protein GX085_06925 [Firmicutes bacterium]|nr:hypothetical protein [Bacillota bacterium]
MAKPELGPEIRLSLQAQIYPLLQWVQRRLNLILSAVEAATCTAWLAAAAGLFLLFRLWPGGAGGTNMRGALLPALLVPLLGLLAGWWRGRRKHLNLAATAFWLDRSLRLQEIFSAALFCLERGCTGMFDREILARAEMAALRIKKPSWPLRPLYRRTLLAVAALLFMVLLPVALGPAFSRQAPSSSGLPSPLMDEEGGFLAREEEGQPVLPEELAGFLFSHDRELAERAAEALRAGDMEALAGLLREAGEEMGHSPAWSVAAQELEKLLAGGGELLPEEEHPGREQGIPPGPRSGDDPVWGGRPGEEPGTPPEEGWIGRVRREGENPSGEGRVRAGEGSGGREGEDDEAQPVAFAGRAGEEGMSREIKGEGGGLTGGEGEVNARGENTEVLAGGPGEEKTVITRSVDSPVFEYVLPDRDPRTPFAAALPQTARAAEEALARAGVPLEYEEYVRLYFQELAREFE